MASMGRTPKGLREGETEREATRIECEGGYVIQQRWDYERRTSTAYHGGGQPFDWWDVYLPDGHRIVTEVNSTGAWSEVHRRQRWDREDASDAAVLTTLTPDQRAALGRLMAPQCCHITGMHDPTHFKDSRYICREQMTESYERLRHALGVPLLQPGEAASKSDCGWCHR